MTYLQAGLLRSESVRRADRGDGKRRHRSPEPKGESQVHAGLSRDACKPCGIRRPASPEPATARISSFPCALHAQLPLAYNPQASANVFERGRVVDPAGGLANLRVCGMARCRSSRLHRGSACPSPPRLAACGASLPKSARCWRWSCQAASGKRPPPSSGPKCLDAFAAPQPSANHST